MINPTYASYKTSPEWGRWGSNPQPRDYEVGAIGRAGPAWSDSSGFLCIHCPVVLDSSGGVELVCGMKRGISLADNHRAQARFGEPYTNGFECRIKRPYRIGDRGSQTPFNFAIP
jgi:hypothetical protein